MQRIDLQLVFDDAVKVATKQLERTRLMPWPSRIRVASVQAARDRLDEACRMFEHGDASVEHEDLYLPLFDALAHVNDALVSYWDRDVCVNRALEALEGTNTMGGRR